MLDSNLVRMVNFTKFKGNNAIKRNVYKTSIFNPSSIYILFEK